MNLLYARGVERDLQVALSGKNLPPCARGAEAFFSQGEAPFFQNSEACGAPWLCASRGV